MCRDELVLKQAIVSLVTPETQGDAAAALLQCFSGAAGWGHAHRAESCLFVGAAHVAKAALLRQPGGRCGSYANTAR